MGTKKEVKNNKKEENVEKEKSKLEMAVDLLNESGLLKKELEFEGDTEEMAEKFMQAVESIPVEKENEIPEEVVNAYNDFVDAAEAKEKEEKAKANKEKSEKVKVKEKEEKTQAKEKDPAAVARGKALAEMRKSIKKGENNSLWTAGSSADICYQAIVSSGKKGISVEEGMKILEGKFPTTNLKGRLLSVWPDAVKRGIAKKIDGRYYAA